MEDGLVLGKTKSIFEGAYVLILVVVEDGLVQHSKHSTERMSLSINPNCSGQWSRTFSFAASANVGMSLNPYCSGQWSRTYRKSSEAKLEASLNPYCDVQWPLTWCYNNIYSQLSAS